MSDPEVRASLETIIGGQRSGVLGTSFMDIPLCSQMAFAAAQDLRTLFVVTPRQTTKYDNMTSNPNVSFLVSTARNDPSDPAGAQAVTATAFATELDGERRHNAVNLFAKRHPSLSAFAAAPDNAVMELKVDSYRLVSNFQKLTRISLG
ncbi:MAG: hypothetical protein Q7J24_00690 [Desulfomicrobium sp.]|nr:hypothetical protein [Desulfomicrobium sp.]